jgi:hypothetical protein
MRHHCGLSYCLPLVRLVYIERYLLPVLLVILAVVPAIG